MKKKEGEAIGEEIGKNKTKKEVVQKMLRKDYTTDEIMELLELTKEELETLINL